ncbi:C-C chemokine receptor type 4-like [Bufo bufo]|uniref:C-C chemokine receptor type 4-like n=1 Tax=Bufo bufo TaxID=8384 RepID=UPI001ABDAD2E|nr:C-C chemokine receptor type 4-like [Bufo bufo]
MPDEGQMGNSTVASTTFMTLNYDEELITICMKTNSISFGATVVPFFFYMVFMISLLGNGLILFLLLKFENVKTVTNFFILNLVVSDLLFTLPLPFWGYYHSHQWIFGKTSCKMLASMFYIGFYSSILFLTMMTVDRYMAVVHAIYSTRTRNLLYVCVVSGTIWVVSFFSAIPKFILYGTREDSILGVLCGETGFNIDKINSWKLVGYYQQLVMFFVLPLIIVLYCYTLIVIKLHYSKMHNKDKAIKLIFFIVLAFFLCWTPYNIIIFIKARQISEDYSDDDCDETIDYAFFICRNIAYFHCCINPFFYTFVGTKFRRHLSLVLGRWVMCGSRSSRSSLSSKTSDYSPQTVYE